MTPLERVSRNIRVGADGCWWWTASTSTSTTRPGRRYGVVSFRGRQRRAHAVVFEMARGPIPEGTELDHLCRNTLCVNPYHLDPVTHRENVLRGSGFAALHARKTHCPQGHEYTPENTRIGRLRGGQCRQCRTCHRERQRAYKARLKAAQVGDGPVERGDVAVRPGD